MCPKSQRNARGFWPSRTILTSRILSKPRISIFWITYFQLIIEFTNYIIRETNHQAIKKQTQFWADFEPNLRVSIGYQIYNLCRFLLILINEPLFAIFLLVCRLFSCSLTFYLLSQLRHTMIVLGWRIIA